MPMPNSGLRPTGGAPVQQVSDVSVRWSDDFGGTTLDLSKWEVEANTGGITYSVSGSNLLVVMGTTANAQLSLLSNEVLSVPFDLNVIAMWSQRIANNSVYFEAVEVDSEGVPVVNPALPTDWLNRASILVSGTGPTSGRLETAGEGGTAPLSLAATLTSTTAPVHLTLEVRAIDVQLLSTTPDVSAGRSTNVALASSQVPDPNKLYRMRMRFKNEATAPASSTTVTIKRVFVQDAQELTVEVASARGDAVAGRGLAVNVAGGTLTAAASTNLVGDVGVQMVSGRGTALSVARLVTAAATTNATLVKASAGKVAQIRGYNAAATVKYLKLYNKATAPTVGTDTPVLTIPLKPASDFAVDFGNFGLTFATGIGYAITGAAADNDTTALAAADVVGLSILYV